VEGDWVTEGAQAARLVDQGMAVRFRMVGCLVQVRRSGDEKASKKVWVS
jgi:hypothetical protein